MKIVITDVSVFFDLYNIKVLPEFFALDWEIMTTDFVYNEILHAEQKDTFEVFERSRRLKIVTTSAEEIEQILEAEFSTGLLSFKDKTIFWKALQLNATLLTSDRRLRKEAKQNTIEVHGSLWVLEQLIVAKLISKKCAVAALNLLKQTNKRLPLKLVEELMKKWSK